jgi:hypothetical protein
MKPAAVGGAVLGGMIGAAVWAAIVYFAQFELGIVAWGVGLAVGYGSYLLGGRGLTNGVMCAIVALIAIFGGKILAVQVTSYQGLLEYVRESPEKLPSRDRTVADEQLARELHAQLTFSDYVQVTIDDLNIIDILFFGLGVLSAYRVGAAEEEAGV